MRNWSRFLSVLAMGSVVSLAMSDQAEAAGGGLPKAPVTQLVTIDRSVGQGDEAKSGQQVSVHYTGWLYDPSKADGKGKKFDSSVDRGQPFGFPHGCWPRDRRLGQGCGRHEGGRQAHPGHSQRHGLGIAWCGRCDPPQCHLDV